MGRHSCCYKQKLRKGLWSPEEDEKLLKHITKYGHGCWSSVPKLAGNATHILQSLPPPKNHNYQCIIITWNWETKEKNKKKKETNFEVKQHNSGLQRCGKSCRLRWINYLRPDLKRGSFSQQEENLIIELHAVLGNRYSSLFFQI